MTSQTYKDQGLCVLVQDGVPDLANACATGEDVDELEARVFL